MWDRRENVRETVLRRVEKVAGPKFAEDQQHRHMHTTKMLMKNDIVLLAEQHEAALQNKEDTKRIEKQLTRLVREEHRREMGDGRYVDCNIVIAFTS